MVSWREAGRVGGGMAGDVMGRGREGRRTLVVLPGAESRSRIAVPS